MTGTTAIIKKELRTYFFSALAYVVIGVFLFFMGVIFAKFVALYHQYNQHQAMGRAQGITVDKLVSFLYQNMAFLLCFVTPFLTMRLFAEERKQQTLELLFTSPIREYELVLGKFFSALILMSTMIGLSFLYVFFLWLWGTPDLLVVLTTYVGMFLSLACYVAIGLLISALTSSQALAAIWTFIALLMLWLLQSLGQGITASLGPIQWGPLMVYVSPLGHFNSFSEGLLHIKDIVYFLSFTVLFLFITHRVVESNRWR